VRCGPAAADTGVAEACVDEFRHPKRILLVAVPRYWWIIRDDDLKSWEAFLAIALRDRQSPSHGRRT
jgi:hypothetical protein